MRAGLVVVATVACALALPGSASAYERQDHLGLTLGGALSTTDGASAKAGIDLGLRYTYGLTDALNVLVDVSGVAVGTEPAPAKNPPPQPGHIAVGGVGLAYVFDVTRWVPYAGALVGPAYFGGGLMPRAKWTFDAQLVVGLDYEVSRSFAVGGAYAQHFVALASTYPELSTLGVHFEYVWGW